MELRTSIRQSVTRLIICALIISILPGCAINPVVSWDPPTRVGSQPTNLDFGRKYAASLRTAYKHEIHKQVGTSTNLNSGLVVAGALALALAVGTAHRDALLGTALIGGTAYGLGGMNLSQQRLLILQAGVEAIDCANRAIIPLNMTTDEIAALESDLKTVLSAQTKLGDAAAAVRAKHVAYKKALGPVNSEISTEADELLRISDELISASNTAGSSGRLLLVRAGQAGDQLVAAIDKIDGAVLKALLATLPDISSVPKVIAGLAGFATAIAPGAGVDTTIAARLATRSGTKSDANSDDSDKVKIAAQALREDIEKLRAEINAMRNSIGNVQARVAAYETAASSLETLRDCGIGDISFPLKVSTDKLIFSLGINATKSFLISGGTRPYVVDLLDTPAPGVTVKGPAPFESRAQVTVNKELKSGQTFSILIMDASNPTKSASVTIQTAEPSPVQSNPNLEGSNKDNGGGSTAKNGLTEKSPTNLTELSQALVAHAYKDGEIKISISDAKIDEANKSLLVTLTCDSVPPSPINYLKALNDVLTHKDIWPGTSSGETFKDKVLIKGADNCIAKKV
jgi:hypothetical protein